MAISYPCKIKTERDRPNYVCFTVKLISKLVASAPGSHRNMIMDTFAGPRSTAYSGPLLLIANVMQIRVNQLSHCYCVHVLSKPLPSLRRDRQPNVVEINAYPPKTGEPSIDHVRTKELVYLAVSWGFLVYYNYTILQII